jgi:hypothetical protein
VSAFVGRGEARRWSQLRCLDSLEPHGCVRETERESRTVRTIGAVVRVAVVTVGGESGPRSAARTANV